jgi:hypothetical protein
VITFQLTSQKFGKDIPGNSRDVCKDVGCLMLYALRSNRKVRCGGIFMEFLTGRNRCTSPSPRRCDANIVYSSSPRPDMGRNTRCMLYYNENHGQLAVCENEQRTHFSNLVAVGPDHSGVSEPFPFSSVKDFGTLSLSTTIGSVVRNNGYVRLYWFALSRASLSGKKARRWRNLGACRNGPIVG